MYRALAMIIRSTLVFVLLLLMFATRTTVASESNSAPHVTPLFSMVRSDQDLSIVGDDVAFTWESDIWVGGDYNKAWFKTEGRHEDGQLHEAELQLLYSRYITPFFDFQVGVRHEFKTEGGDPVSYGVFGLQGLTPYRFEVDAAFFVGENGDVAFRAELEYYVWLTQRLVVQPYFETDLWLTRDSVLDFQSGLSEIDSGVKILYHVRRELAPYIDLNVLRVLGSSKTNALLVGERVKDFAVRVGVRAVF